MIQARNFYNFHPHIASNTCQKKSKLVYFSRTGWYLAAKGGPVWSFFPQVPPPRDAPDFDDNRDVKHNISQKNCDKIE